MTASVDAPHGEGWVEDLSILLRCQPCDGERSCAYLLGENEKRRICGMPRRRGSSYCAHHHALCHVPSGTSQEVRRLREVEALANAVGGGRGSDGGAPSRHFLKRLEHVLRDSAR